MGIRGLTTLINENPGLLCEFELKSTPVVVDGSNLIYRMFVSFKVECSFCGEYLAFKNATLSFLNRLHAAEVSPLFVFDGPIDGYESKFQTVIKRHKEAINFAVQVMQQRGNFVLPMLACDLFFRLLHQQNVSVLVCPGDADRTIAACANYLNCPVISMDSDFFIFPLNNGYIPFNSIDLSDSVPRGAIKCAIYKADNWLKYLPRFDKTLLPVFAVVTGNDFFQTNVFEKFFDHVSKSQVPIKDVHWGTLKNMVGFLQWLQGKSHSDALECLLTFVDNENRQGLRKELENALSFYNVNASSVEECQRQTVSQLSACGFPTWFTEAYCRGKLYRLTSTVYVRRGQAMFLQIALENMSLSCVHECSKPLRATMYGIMLKGTGYRLVTEYARVSDAYRPISTAIREDVPSLNDIPSLSRDERRRILTNDFSLSLRDLDAIPEQLHLFALSLKAWTTYSSKEQTTGQMALAIVATAIHINAKPTTTSESLRRLYKKPLIESHQEKNRYSTFVHAANQWQSCLGTFQCLNELLMQPFREADISHLFSGKLAFNLYQCVLCSRRPIETMLSMLPSTATVFGVPPDQILTKLQLIVPLAKQVTLTRAEVPTSKTTNKARSPIKKELVTCIDVNSDTSTSDWDDDNPYALLKSLR